MLPLKPGLFPLPRLRCLLFLQAAFHSSFNSLQTLPNGFFTRGPRARSPLPRDFTPPSDTTKGDPFPTLPPLPSVLLPLHPGHGGGRGVDPSWWGWQMSLMWGQVTRCSPPARAGTPCHRDTRDTRGGSQQCHHPVWCQALEWPDPLVPGH